MDINTAIMQRRSIRRFQRKPIEKQVLLDMIALSRLYASGGNLQPIRYVLATNQEKLDAIDGIRINGDLNNRLPGHLHVTIERANTQLLLMQLDMAGIAASAGSACSSGAAERSHVISAMGLAGENQADIRFTLSQTNTAAEIETVVSTLRRILRR